MCVDGELSDWIYVISGIPQGSVLGPILFVIFINDMPKVIKNYCKLFADDANLYARITCKDDNALLQEDLDRITQWSLLWELPFNEDKCKCMHIGKENNKHSYHMNDYALQNVKEEKDLGIFIDDKLKFHTHTSSVIKKANSILGLIKRSFSVLDENTLPRLYKSMVRPHLEYGNVIWGPHYKDDMKAIEKVQKRATKIVPSLKNLP